MTDTRQTVNFRRAKWISLFCVVAIAALCLAQGKRWISANSSAPGNVGLPDISMDVPPDQQHSISTTEADAADQHPLDPVLELAQEALTNLQATVADYEAVLVKRERINGKFVGPQKLLIKIQNRKQQDGQMVVPFAVYMKFLEPDSVAGREAIWVENRHDGKLVAHDTGLAGLIRVKLDPHGAIAMAGSRYPICNVGFEYMIEELLRKGQRDRQRDECRVTTTAATVEGRNCTLIEVRHPQPQPHFDFHIAHIFIDDELNLPVRYAAYSWPATEGGEPMLEEEYTYLDVKLNVGLTELDFDPDNPAYEFP